MNSKLYSLKDEANLKYKYLTMENKKRTIYFLSLILINSLLLATNIFLYINIKSLVTG